MKLLGPSDRSALWFSSGRQALFALCSELVKLGLKTAWLPEYHCASMVSPFVCAGADVRFYPVGDALQPEADALVSVGSGDAVVVVHYFGRPYDFTEVARLCLERDAVLVEDAAHADLSFEHVRRTVGKLGRFVLSCPRKFYPIYDGAILTGDPFVVSQIRQRSPSLREQAKSLVALTKRAKHHAGVIGAVHSGAADRALESTDSSYIDPRFDVGARTRATIASKVAWKLMRNGRRKQARRMERFAAIHRAVTEGSFAKPLYSEVPKEMVPYFYPAILKQADDFHRLRSFGINALRWENLTGEPTDRIRRLQPRLVQLPCSDTMAEADFRRLLSLLRDWQSGSE